MAQPSQKQIIKAVDAFINAQTRDETKRIIEAERDKLLTDSADYIFAILLEQYKGNASISRLLEEQRNLLVLCRRDGIKVAFDEYMHLQALLDEIVNPISLEDMFRHLQVCQSALRLVNRKANPLTWAYLQQQLGFNLANNSQGNLAENLKQAIRHFKLALTVYTRKTYPLEWAIIQGVLANFYFLDIQEERAENLELAIKHNQRALTVYTSEAFPQEWAQTQCSLASDYLERIQGERAENLELAIKHNQRALTVYTSEAFPQEWAQTQYSLARCYNLRIRGERAENLELAIWYYQQELTVVTSQSYPQEWAQTQHSLARCYNLRIRGERAENLELAIKHNQSALTVFTSQSYPQEWAQTQHSLAIDYQERIRGERAENLELAIQHDQLALTVSTRELYPEEWALAQYNLANTYLLRIRGERAENIEKALHLNGLALTVYTHQAFPSYWAMVQHHRADAYRMRYRGDRAENLEQAIKHCQEALIVYTQETFPEPRAMVFQNLARCYSFRIRGERAQNLEQAIECCHEALTVYTRESYPELWALVQRNLATIYLGRIRGERAQNLEQAIECCHEALTVYTHQAFPEDWAWTQGILGETYLGRIRGERAQNLEQAIECCHEALTVYTRESYPELWALHQYDLANAYELRIRGERKKNLEQAIRLNKQVLTVYKRESYPEHWAMTQISLANSYLKRIRGEHAENLEQALQYGQEALKVYTPTAFPQRCRDSAYTFGYLLYSAHRFSEARRILEMSHQAVEALRGEVQRDVAKRSLAEENADLYARLVFCCLRESDEDAAFKYAVAGKGRAFVDLLATARLDLSTMGTDNPMLADDLREERALHQQIDNLRVALTDENSLPLSRSFHTTGINIPERMPFSVDGLRAQLSTLQVQVASHWEEMSYKYPALTATQKTPPLSIDQARTLAAELNVTLVEYYQHSEGWCAFVVTSNTVNYIPLPLVNDTLLERMMYWTQLVKSPYGRNRMSYDHLSEWYSAVIAPLQESFLQERPIVLAPFGRLHVLPLAAALDPLTEHYFAEDYQIAFVPSLAALSTAWNQARRTDRDEQAVPHRLLSVAYPGASNSSHYLPGVLPEAKAISRHFVQITSLYEERATPDAVVEHSHGQDVVHFGCHGWFDTEQPEQSGLLLAGGWLTVQRIITELRLEQTRLVTLGACLSGRAALKEGEEHVGLMQAMLSTGVQVVVASLWSVDDAATRVLFEAFYTRLAAGRSPARAMQEAAQFVRERPGWAHPYYWAAFQVSGLAHSAQVPVQVPVPTHLEVRVEAVQQRSTRGDRPMNTEQSIEGALVLLEQMSKYPHEVLKNLDEVQQAAVMGELNTLAEQAATVQSDTDLLSLADAIHRLVEDQLGLRSLLLPEETDVATERSQRTVTMADHLVATDQNTYAQKRAPQMRNAVIECREQLEAVLKRTEKPKHKRNGEKKR